MNTRKETILNNGLRVITNEGASSPIVNMEVWVNAGSRYENAEHWGYAHILEHMLLKGTSKRPTSFEMGLEKDRVGAAANAFTGREAARFTIQVAHQHTENMLELLSDTLLHSLIEPQILENEKGIILEELQKYFENHDRYASIQGSRKFFGDHPLAKDPIGNPETIKKATHKTLKEYFRKFYLANNSALIASGHITHERAVELAKKYFGKWASGDIYDNFTPLTTPPTERYFFQKHPTKQTFLRFHYRTPGAVSVRALLALDILSNYLSYGYSSLLIHELRTKRGLIYHMETPHLPYRDTGMFVIATSTTRPRETRDAILEIMTSMKSSLTPSLVEELKKQTISVFNRRLATPGTDTAFLGNGFTLYKRLIAPEEYTENIATITREEIIEIVEKYLTQENNFLFVLGPEDIQ